MRFVSREEARELLEKSFEGHCACCGNMHALKRFDHWRNYEIEQRLHTHVPNGEGWCINEWCPFNGRFCALARYVPYPHPPLKGEDPHLPETAIPWNSWQPGMTETLR